MVGLDTGAIPAPVSRSRLGSIRQAEEHPSHPFVFPSSHFSPASTLPFPQAAHWILTLEHVEEQ